MRKRNPGNKKKSKLSTFVMVVVVLLLIIIPAILAFIHFSPVGRLQPSYAPITEIPTGSLGVNWPTDAEAAIGVSGYGLLASGPTQAAFPTASVAKILTALSVLKMKPLPLGQQGPYITINSSDVASYLTYSAEGGSVVKVVQGEQITEYQALQAMLLPSANNIADTLATWAFGSVANYVAYANPYAKTLGMRTTNIADASGYSPQTTSTPTDLISLGQAALNDPVIAQIVKQPSAIIPVAGTIKNVDWLLGQDGVIGIKTGNTDQAGGCYLFAATYGQAGQSITIIGAVTKATTLQIAIDDAANLLQQIKPQILTKDPVPSDVSLVEYRSKWGQSSGAEAAIPAILTYLPGMTVKASVTAKSIGIPSSSGEQVGQINLSVGGKSATSSLNLENSINRPGWSWVLAHPNKL